MSEILVNKLSSLTGTNNDITIDPDGTGDTVISSGNVGIGTQSPARKFHIETADNIIGLIESTDADAWLAFKDNTSSTDNAVRVGATGDNLRFYAGSGERLRINSTGRLLVNTTNASPSNISSGTVGGCSFGEDNGGEIASDAYNTFQINKLNSTSGGLIAFRYNATQVGYIGTNGTTTSYNTSSDYRLKENVTAITSATD